MNDNLIVVLIHTKQYRGDHDADITFSEIVTPETTIAELQKLYRNDTDSITIPARYKKEEF